MSLNELYRLYAHMTCFDGEGEGEGTGEGVGDQPKPKEGEGTGEIRTPDGFSDEQQKKFNDAIAAERRKQETKYRRELEKVEATYKELLENNTSLSEKERATLQENLETIQGQLRSKEEEAARQKRELEQSYKNKLTEAEKRAEAAEERWRDSTIKRSLQDAAIEHEAHDPSQIIKFLREDTRLVEQVDEKTGKGNGQFTVVVTFLDKDDTGKEIKTSKTPSEAVKRMTEIESSKNLFKRNVVSGIGGNSATGGLNIGSNGRIDVRDMSADQYQKIRKENPELLGLRKRRR